MKKLLISVLTVTLAAPALAELPINEYPAISGTYSGRFSGKYTATVTSGKLGEGTTAGAASYSYQFEVPSQPSLTNAQCDPTSPVTSPGDCDRSCIKMDSAKRYETGYLTGVPAFGSTPSCGSPISGIFQDYSVTEAYDLCDAQNAWGGTAITHSTIKAGPLFHFNNPRTQHIGNIWTYTNNAELLWPQLTLSVQVIVTCNTSITLTPLPTLGTHLTTPIKPNPNQVLVAPNPKKPPPKVNLRPKVIKKIWCLVNGRQVRCKRQP